MREACVQRVRFQILNNFYLFSFYYSYDPILYPFLNRLQDLLIKLFYLLNNVPPVQRIRLSYFEHDLSLFGGLVSTAWRPQRVDQILSPRLRRRKVGSTNVSCTRYAIIKTVHYINSLSYFPQALRTKSQGGDSYYRSLDVPIKWSPHRLEWIQQEKCGVGRTPVRSMANACKNSTPSLGIHGTPQ